MSVTPDTTPAVDAPEVTIPAPRVATEDAGLPPTGPAPAASGSAPDAAGASDGTGDGTVVDPCRCGHGRDAHEHYRSGTDCSACGTACGAFHPAAGRGVRALVRRALGRT